MNAEQERAPKQDPTEDAEMAIEFARHADVGRVLEHIMKGKLTKPVRDAVRKALDAADAPPSGRAAQDHALGRAIRYTR